MVETNPLEVLPEESLKDTGLFKPKNRKSRMRGSVTTDRAPKDVELNIGFNVSNKDNGERG